MSGLMGALATDTIAGYNSLLNDQKKLGQKSPSHRAKLGVKILVGTEI